MCIHDTQYLTYTLKNYQFPNGLVDSDSEKASLFISVLALFKICWNTNIDKGIGMEKRFVQMT